MVRVDAQDYCIHAGLPVLKCMEMIDKNRHGIALVVDGGGLLVGTVTDGDVRRFLLRGGSLDQPIDRAMWTNPRTAAIDTPEAELVGLMRQYIIRSIPLIDEMGRPLAVAHLLNGDGADYTEHSVVIMAGGEGKRLRPLTEHIPKPMVRIGDKPILETIIDQLVEHNLRQVFISLNYKGEVIENYFGDGSRHGVEITYIKEDKPLGTAGSLSLLDKKPSRELIVVNGDVITKINFARLLDFHREHRSVMTVGAIQYTFPIPLGVIEHAGHYLLGVHEKPNEKFLCNAGVYILDPDVLSFIPYNTFYHQTDLIQELVRRGLPVATFPIHEYWIDIGQKEDLLRFHKEVSQI